MRDIDILKQIDRYLNGKLSEAEIDQLWKEIIKKPEYLQWLEVEASAREYFLESNSNNPAPSSFNRSELKKTNAENHSSFFHNYRYWFYGVAAVLAIFVLIHITPFDRSGLKGDTVASISVEEMATADIYRTTGERVNPIDVEINRGFEAAISGRLTESHAIYEALMDSSLSVSQKAVVNLNYGILLYNNKAYPEAETAFRSALEYEDIPDYIAEKGWWYLGNTLIHTDEVEAARDAITMVYNLGGRFKADADRLINRIDKVSAENR